MPIALPNPQTDVQIDDAQAAAGHRVAIGHCHNGDFLQAEDVLQSRIVEQRIIERQLGSTGLPKIYRTPASANSWIKA